MKVITTIDQLSGALDKTIRALVSCGVRMATSIENARGVAVWKDRTRHLFAYLHIFWLELCNLHRHTEILRKKRLHYHGIVLETGAERRARRCGLAYNYALARRRGIQALWTIHPTATLIDLCFLTEIISLRLFGKIWIRECY